MLSESDLWAAYLRGDLTVWEWAETVSLQRAVARARKSLAARPHRVTTDSAGRQVSTGPDGLTVRTMPDWGQQ